MIPPRSPLLILLTSCTAAITLLAVQPRAALAQNLGFMPGDAFFAFWLTEDIAMNVPEHRAQIVLPYATPLCNFGGYAGFSNLEIKEASTRFLDDIRRVYLEHRNIVHKVVAIDRRDDGTRLETEMNAPLCLVYNRDTDWSKQRMALKYNENWFRLPDEAFSGPGRNLDGELFSRAEVYQPLVRTFESVVEDWRNASHYRALDARLPDGVAWGKAHRAIDEPVIVCADQIQIIVTTSEVIEEFYSQQDVTFYQITSAGVKVCKWKRHGARVRLIEDDLQQDMRDADVSWPQGK